MSLIHVKNLTFTYDGSYEPVFENASFQIDTGWRLGLIGRNGRGKTTLLRLLCGTYPYQGTISVSTPVSYFPYLIRRPEAPAIDAVSEMEPDYELWRLQCEMEKLRLDESILLRSYATLSGGEQTKLQLAVLFSSEQHYLLIDEPTNHLDIPSREALEAALLDFDGTMLVVSHDRYFINKLSTRVLSIGMNGAESFEGGYDDYAAKIAEQSAEKPKAAKTMGKGGEDYKRRKERESELRRTITTIKKCEERINDLDGLIAKTNEEMSTPEAAADYARVMELTETLGKLNDEQTELMMQWEELENRKAQLEGKE